MLFTGTAYKAALFDSKRRLLGRRQAVRHRFLVPTFPGSNPGAPANHEQNWALRPEPPRHPSRAVPEPLSRVLFQGSHDVFCVFLGLVFASRRKDLPHHDAYGFIAEFLRHRHQPHASLGKAAHMHLLQERIAHETAERMDDNHIKGRCARGSGIQKSLEFRPVVVGAGQAGFDEFRHHLPATRLNTSILLLCLSRWSM